MDRFFSSAILMALVFYFLSSCQSEKIDENTQQVKNSASSNLLTEVKVVTAQKKLFEYHIHTQGKISSSRQVSLQFETPGFLLATYKKNGSIVKKKEVIAELNQKKSELALRKAKVTLAEKELAYNDLIVQYYGEKPEQPEIDKEVKQNLQIKSGLLQARLAMEEAQFNLENSTLLAPFSGIVADIKDRPGDLVSTERPFCVLYNPSTLQIDADILEDDFNEISIGQKAKIKVLSYDDQYFEATVSEINPKINENGLVSVKLSLSQQQGLLPGMNASVVIKVPKENNVIVPKEAVVIRSGKKVIFTLEDGLAKWNYITTGLENGKEIETLEGLEEGEKVIVTNNLQLAHDAPVTVMETNKSL